MRDPSTCERERVCELKQNRPPEKQGQQRRVRHSGGGTWWLSNPSLMESISVAAGLRREGKVAREHSTVFGP